VIIKTEAFFSVGFLGFLIVNNYTNDIQTNSICYLMDSSNELVDLWKKNISTETNVLEISQNFIYTSQSKLNQYKDKKSLNYQLLLFRLKVEKT